MQSEHIYKYLDMSALAKEQNIKYTGKKEMRNFELDNQRQLDVMSWVNTIL